jgi:hypothetical protein
MASRYKSKVFEEWLEGHVKRPGSRQAPDPDKVRAVQLLSVHMFCPVERIMVRWIDIACFAWKPKEVAP